MGARGYVGHELLRLLANHAGFSVTAVGSRGLAGTDLGTIHPRLSGLRFVKPTVDLCLGQDVVVLALPDGLSADYVAGIEKHSPKTIILDLSSDYRFDNDWVYGLTEHNRKNIRGAGRISNPGCYATAMQVALKPMVSLLKGMPRCFGISGYSGAGTRPSPKNDPERLKDNVLPYRLVNHVHEREVTRHLAVPVGFTPCVAGFFRGLQVTIGFELQHAMKADVLLGRYRDFYGRESFVSVVEEIPEIRQVVNTPHCLVGGIAVQTGYGAMVCVLDNLLKGAAGQALQNLNLACGFEETRGLLD